MLPERRYRAPPTMSLDVLAGCMEGPVPMAGALARCLPNLVKFSSTGSGYRAKWAARGWRMSTVAGLSRLTRLDWMYKGMSAACMDALASLPQLQQLACYLQWPATLGMSRLLAVTRLDAFGHLDEHGAMLWTDAALAAISAMPALEALRICTCDCASLSPPCACASTAGPKGVGWLVRAPDLRDLIIYQCGTAAVIDDWRLGLLTSSPSIRRIFIGANGMGCNGLSAAAVAYIQQQSPGVPTIKASGY